MFLVMQIVGCSNGAQVTCFTSEEHCTVACVASFLAMHYRLSLSLIAFQHVYLEYQAPGTYGMFTFYGFV